jgi:hypothetical protein
MENHPLRILLLVLLKANIQDKLVCLSMYVLVLIDGFSSLLYLFFFSFTSPFIFLTGRDFLDLKGLCITTYASFSLSLSLLL